ncbi:patatin-like protein [Ideonella sp. B7]|uniref:patatin-like protein n=1 Tax=Ideonella benzenivorans TaxID=2831643 RepID=UPI001CECCA52|nr:patatin-like protein [Ideonella benzenivorans]MCA6215660.1 patatin-like protein [Ideonella benzenivorans]
MGPSSLQPDYASEVRFGVVMYGGVALAIYINGVANELYELACATPKRGDVPAPEGSTRAVYRRLSWLLHDPALRAAYLQHLDGQGPDPFAQGEPAEHGQRVRFVVDVISGTSAGGINGIFLAKALAQGQAFAPLKQLWVDEGDIARLINDKASYAGIEYAQREGAPQSLLNSDRMYLKLLDAMEAMAPAVPPVGRDESALSDELDLFVTTTDIRGAVVPLRLADKVVHEKRHKQVLQLQYRGAGGQTLYSDFRTELTPFLAFAARCTSSFPFAFEPMTVEDALRLARLRPGGGAVEPSAWRGYLKGLSADDLASGQWQRRAFGDGGYLDNKPFSYAVEALSWRLSALPMERKLLYVEPTPEHPERERQVFDAKPDALQNAVDALARIPQYETIREDLEAVLKRNRRIERVERIVRRVELDVETLAEEPFARVLLDQNGEVPDWSALDLGDMIRYYGAAFLPYRRLRLETVSDDLADRLAMRWGVDRHADLQYAMRALVRAWREARYFEHRDEANAQHRASVNAFLEAYDLGYRLRRVGFLLRKTHQLGRLLQGLRTAGASLSEADEALRQRLQRYGDPAALAGSRGVDAALVQLRAGLARAMGELREANWPGPDQRPAKGTEDERQQLQRVLRLLLGEALDPPLTALPSEDGGEVSIALGRLPPLQAQRTLQENVFARAQALFQLANAGRRTHLQALLEDDLAGLGTQFRRYTRRSPERSATALLVRELLGQPRLVPQAAGPRRRITVQLQPVQNSGDDAALNSPAGHTLRQLLAEYYLRFDEYDQMSFPLYYDTGTSEPAAVEVVRVSPEDAPSLVPPQVGGRRKLAGDSLFHFGGFLDARWRRNDIMWGRLDGAERLLAALLPGEDDTRLREALLAQAQRAILREEMAPEGYDELVHRFADALLAQGQPTLQQAFGALWQQLGPDDAARGQRTAQALKAVLGDGGLLAYVAGQYEVNRQLDTPRMLDNAARAVTVTGRLLQALEQKQRMQASRAVWLTRSGLALQALLAVSLPGSLPRAVLRHGLVLLYGVEGLVLLGGWLLAAPGARNFALAALALTAMVHLATVLTGDLMVRRTGRLKAAAALLALVLGCLAGVGGWTLWQFGPTAVLCTVPALADGLGRLCDEPTDPAPDGSDEDVSPPPT